MKKSFKDGIGDCPHCGGITKIIDSRAIRNSRIKVVKRRRRLCLNCERRFTTWEMVSVNYNSVVTEIEQIYKHLEKLQTRLTKAHKNLMKVTDEEL